MLVDLRSLKDLFPPDSKYRCFPGGGVVKNPSANAGDTRDAGLITKSGRSRGGGKW